MTDTAALVVRALSASPALSGHVGTNISIAPAPDSTSGSFVVVRPIQTIELAPPATNWTQDMLQIECVSEDYGDAHDMRLHARDVLLALRGVHPEGIVQTVRMDPAFHRVEKSVIPYRYVWMLSVVLTVRDP